MNGGLHVSGDDGGLHAEPLGPSRLGAAALSRAAAVTAVSAVIARGIALTAFGAVLCCSLQEM